MLRRQDYVISYLPLAHIYMRVLQMFAVNMGMAVGFWQGSTPSLFEDIGVLRVTNLFLVPRIIQKMVEGMQKRIASLPDAQ